LNATKYCTIGSASTVVLGRLIAPFARRNNGADHGGKYAQGARQETEPHGRFKSRHHQKEKPNGAGHACSDNAKPEGAAAQLPRHEVVSLLIRALPVAPQLEQLLWGFGLRQGSTPMGSNVTVQRRRAAVCALPLYPSSSAASRLLCDARNASKPILFRDDVQLLTLFTELQGLFDLAPVR
jgi:hypothetical protein